MSDKLIRRRTGEDQPILVAGHRGMMALYPENTLLSFEKAIDAGVDMLEFDLRLTRDGEIVVIHDATVDRTTNGTGPVSEMSLDQIKALDAGKGFNGQYAGQQIPTLREFCQLIAPYPKLLLNVEIKSYTRETVDKTVAMLGDFGIMDNCAFTAFDADILAYMHDHHRLLTQGFPKEYLLNYAPDTYRKMYAVGIALNPFKSKPNMPCLTPELAAHFRDQGIHPWAFAPDDTDAVAHCIQCGARLMTCNDPRPALRYLGR